MGRPKTKIEKDNYTIRHAKATIKKARKLHPDLMKKGREWLDQMAEKK